MLDPVREKCDLHIRAAGIFFMQLELLEIPRLVALCHKKGANVDEDRTLATHGQNLRAAAAVLVVQSFRFPFAIIPKMQSRA